MDGIWLGAANDVIMRERGIEFVDGTAPGFAAVTGAAPTNQIAVKIARELQEKNLYVFMAGCTNGKQFAEQLAEEGVQLGWETRLVPFGRDVSALIYALGFANRAALSFGGVKPGDFAANLKYNKNRIFAFVLALGEVTPDKYAAAAGAINYGFPVIADTDIPQILPTGVCTYEHVVSQVPLRDDGGEGARSARLQGQDHQGADPRALRPGVRGRAHPQGGCPRRVRRQQDHRLRVRDHGRPGPDRRRRDRGHRPGH